MIKLDNKFFFRTTWFPEKSGKPMKPWSLKGSIISSTFPNSLHFAHVMGTGRIRKGPEEPIRLTQSLELIHQNFIAGKKGSLIQNPFLSIEDSRACLWVNDGHWKKNFLEVPPDLLVALKNPERFLARDQKVLLENNILWELKEAGKVTLKKKRIPSEAKARKINLSLLRSASGVIHPPVEKTMSADSLKDIVQAISSLEEIFSPCSEKGDHRSSMQLFREEFSRRYGIKSVKLSEVFEPIKGLSFPYVERSFPEFSPQLRSKLLSFIEKDSSEIVLKDSDLKLLKVAAAKSNHPEKIQSGYVRMSSVFIAGSWKQVIHDVTNSRVIRPFFKAATLDTQMEDQFKSGLTKNDYQILLNYPQEFGSSVNVGRTLSRAILLDHREFRQGDIWWKDLNCSLKGNRFILQTSSGKVVRPVFPAQVARELIELDVYRFLKAVEDNGSPSTISWLWPLDNAHTFFPRVTYGNIILSPKFWLMTLKDLNSCFNNPGSRLARGIDENVFICHGSEKFLISFKEKSYFQNLMKRFNSDEFKKIKSFRVEEAYQGEKLGAQGNDDSYYREEIFLGFKNPPQ